MTALHWLGTYPHIVCASVLLLDGKIEGWKVGQHKWDSPLDAKAVWKEDRLKDYTTVTVEWAVDDSAEHMAVFERIAPEWFKQWGIADDFWGCKPYGDAGFITKEMAKRVQQCPEREG